MIYVDCDIPSRQLPTPVSISTNDAINVCVVVIGSHSNQMFIATVYMTPWATSCDTSDLCEQLDALATRYAKLVIVGA